MMPGLKTNPIRRLALTALAILVGLSVFVSCMFLAAEADHDCEGDHCAVCSVMQAAAQVVSLGADRPVVLVSCALAFAACILILLPKRIVRCAQTPVSLGIRLNI